MKDKKSLIIYYDYLDTIFSELTPEEIGQLIIAIIRYERDGELTEFQDRTVRTAYKRMMNDSDNNVDKYLERCEKNRENVMKRWNKENPN